MPCREGAGPHEGPCIPSNRSRKLPTGESRRQTANSDLGRMRDTMVKQIIGGALPRDPADRTGPIIAEGLTKGTVQACNLGFIDHLRRTVAQIWLKIGGAKNASDQLSALHRRQGFGDAGDGVRTDPANVIILHGDCHR